jgi:hypothetical protein
MRRQIGQRLRLRRTPELEFVFDESIAHQDRVEQLLQELREQEAAAEPIPQSPLSMTHPANKSIQDHPPRHPAAAEFRADVARAAGWRRHRLQLAMAYALKALGKSARCIGKDPAPSQFQPFPASAGLSWRLSMNRPTPIVMECGDLAAPRAGAREIFHHQHRSPSGQRDVWRDQLVRRDRVRLREMVFDVIEALDVPLTAEMATHLHVAILTDALPLRQHHAAHVRDLPPVREPAPIRQPSRARSMTPARSAVSD